VVLEIMTKRATQNRMLALLCLVYLVSIIVTRAPILFVLIYHFLAVVVFLFLLANLLNKKHVVLVTACLAIFYLLLWIANDFLLENSPVSALIATNIVLVLLFLVFLMNIKPPRKIKAIGLSSAMLVCVFVFLTFIRLVPSKTEQHSTVDLLRTLGYVTSVSDEKAHGTNGVSVYDRSLAQQGYNLYTSIGTRQTYLIDMSGNVVHTWANSKDRIDFVVAYEADELVAMTNKRHLIRMGWDSEKKWDIDFCSHHDIDIGGEGEIYTLSWIEKIVSVGGFPVPVINDAVILEIAPTGIVKREISLFELFRDRIPLWRVPKIYAFPIFLKPYYPLHSLKNFFEREPVLQYDSPFDVFHANAIRIIDGDIPGFCQKGNFLVSIRELDTVAVINVTDMRIVWEWGPGHLEYQHNSTLLENGHILIFDNGTRRGFSRVIEIDPLSNEVVWEYRGDPVETFYSPRRGGAQRLPNGNTLITESDSGRVFEVTAEGEVAWEFFNPDRDADGDRLRIYRMERVTDFDRLAALGPAVPSGGSAAAHTSGNGPATNRGSEDD
jgi:hypothetical protein